MLLAQRAENLPPFSFYTEKSCRQLITENITRKIQRRYTCGKSTHPHTRKNPYVTRMENPTHTKHTKRNNRIRKITHITPCGKTCATLRKICGRFSLLLTPSDSFICVYTHMENYRVLYRLILDYIRPYPYGTIKHTTRKDARGTIERKNIRTTWNDPMIILIRKNTIQNILIWKILIWKILY